VTGRTRVIPYGPYLAAAAAAMLVLREPVYEIFDTLVLRR
jgi:prepilin signal peptidase PulO-like enzyme (type II secretory pathway)